MKYLNYLLCLILSTCNGQPSKFWNIKAPISDDWVLTQIADITVNGRDGVTGDTLNVGGTTYMYWFGGINYNTTPNSQRSYGRFDEAGGTDSIGIFPFVAFNENMALTLNNKIYLLNEDTLWSYDSADNFDSIGVVSCITGVGTYNYTLLDNGEFMIWGGTTSGSCGFTRDFVFTFDTLGNCTYLDTVLYGARFAANRRTPRFPQSGNTAKYITIGGGDCLSGEFSQGVNNEYWIEAGQSGTDWTNKGTAPHYAMWMSSASLNDNLFVCCGYTSMHDYNDVFVTSDTTNVEVWAEINNTMEGRHAAMMFELDGSIFILFGKCGATATGTCPSPPNDFSQKVYKISPAP